MSGLTLVVQRSLAAPVDRIWRAWTDPAQVARWWGPEGVHCEGVEIDLRVGGALTIGNRLPDGAVVWIRGVFEVVEPGARLVYTWQMGASPSVERVTVRFEAEGEGTRLVIVHERLADEASRDGHEAGWLGCLDGLQRLVGQG